MKRLDGQDIADLPLLSLFKRKDSKATATLYLTGLMGNTPRKTSWQMSEAAGRLKPYAMQNLLDRMQWDADSAIVDLQKYVVRALGKKQSALILDETGFLKKGVHSAGVQRQYSGTAGRIENSQVGVFLAYSTSKGHALIDRRLFLPQSWNHDGTRRAEAHIPNEKMHVSKPKLGQEMVAQALARGICADWVLGDEIYGNDGGLRFWCRQNGQPYAFAVSSNHSAWRGYQQVRAKLLLASSHNRIWEKMHTGLGTKGPRMFEWAVLTGREEIYFGDFSSYLIARRSLKRPEEVRFFSVFCHSATTLQQIVWAIGQRWQIEECFEDAKGEVGLDHYEVRTWHGWHKHITLAMWAYAYLVDCKVRTDLKKKRDLSGKLK